MESKAAESFNISAVDKLRVLAQKIELGDANAFKEFFILTQPGIYKFLLRYLSDTDAAKDLTQDTYINFWTHRSTLNPSQSPKAYLYKIARNLALNYLTRNHFEQKVSINKKDVISILLSPEEEYERHLLIDDFQNAVNELPERCRATFILCKYEGFHYSEIAEILDVSLQTVKNQMNKSISILKRLLSSYLS